jgi:hypothetical protein
MLYALLMLGVLVALIGFARRQAWAMPVFLLVLMATTYAFVSDITDPLKISL